MTNLVGITGQNHLRERVGFAPNSFRNIKRSTIPACDPPAHASGSDLKCARSNLISKLLYDKIKLQNLIFGIKIKWKKFLVKAVSSPNITRNLNIVRVK